MIKFRPRYLLIASALFIVEVCIALFFHDNFIRPFFGDFLVVILLYYFFKSFLDISTLILAGSVLLFSFCIEILQYFKIVEVLGLQNSKLAKTVLGTNFHWSDFIAYTAGILLILLLEKWNWAARQSKN